MYSKATINQTKRHRRTTDIELERMNDMKKYYADIYHAGTSTHVMIGEYSLEALDRSILACIKQRGFEEEDCIWTVRVDII